MSNPLVKGITGEVELVQLDEMKMVGIPVIVSFKDGDYSKIGKTKELFLERKGEIKHPVNPELYWAPWYSCEVMFTYFYCLEVSELAEIPDGMMGFTVPKGKYTKVSYEGPHPGGTDPYAVLAAYRQEHQMSHKEDGMVLEKYPFDQDGIPEWISIEVFGPVDLEN
ncbi:GyrI-like domain-containing protein [Paenibacillus mendelii]|uniref:GyrI-like domain-containing protein n=1 Tax=Paenibacillus mendelii TaxID=206163 RepID=A0ABV6JB29_9BACL|nr:effector binding domain-containing protein [Paenibacillus mendelii]MCQ6562985.1 GyrI-like domain-containing protein [Paenibacillus mendelii]